MTLRLAHRIGEAAEPLDGLADTLQGVVREAFAGSPGPLRDALDGTWLGAPLHVALTDVPVGAWTAGFLLDAVEAATGSRSAGRAADGALLVGVAGAVPAALTGLNDWSHLRGTSRRVGLVHALLNSTALALNVAALGARRAGRRKAGRRLAAAGFAVAGVSAHLGGQLSFGLGVRVNRTAWQGGGDEWTPVLDASELGGTELRRVEVDGTPVVVTRTQAGEPCAIAATCSHLGGPLDRGERVGDVVVCPWHRSHFDLCTGEVVHGPAVFPQPRWDVRLQDGKVQVRAAERA